MQKNEDYSDENTELNNKTIKDSNIELDDVPEPPLGVRIIAPPDIISKTRMAKMKKQFKNNVHKNDILNGLPFDGYNEVIKNNVRIITLVNRRQMLQNKIKTKTRSTPDWRMYNNLLKDFRGSPVEHLLPTPTNIRKDPDKYLKQLEMLQKMLPKNKLEKYVDFVLKKR